MDLSIKEMLYLIIGYCFFMFLKNIIIQKIYDKIGRNRFSMIEEIIPIIKGHTIYYRTYYTKNGFSVHLLISNGERPYNICLNNSNCLISYGDLEMTFDFSYSDLKNKHKIMEYISNRFSHAGLPEPHNYKEYLREYKLEKILNTSE